MNISPEYLALQQELHRSPDYGVASVGFVTIVAKLIAETGAASLTDYGAGKCRLREALRQQGVEIDYRPYDPAFPEYGSPQPADLVCCIDVLEHIEPEHLGSVLDELQRLTVRHGFFTVHTGPAGKHLADGRNAHLIQQPFPWWRTELEKRFRLLRASSTPRGFMVLVEPLGAGA